MQQAAGSGAGGQIRSVQALRALAALAVVGYHATILWHDRAAPLPMAAPVHPWENGNAGVDLFFVISGFIMVFSSRRLVGRQDGWRRFLELRLIRIVPLYWVATAAKLASIEAVPALALHARPTAWNAVASFLFIPSRNALGIVSPVLVVGWTLSFEMLFYAVFAAGLAATVQPALLASAMLAPLAVLALVRGPDWPAIASLADPIVLEFVFGMVVARLLLSHRLQVLPRGVGWALLLGGLAVLALVPAPSPWQRLAIWGVAAAATLAGALALERALDPKLPRALVRLGEASYALYLSHGFVLPVLGLVAVRAHLSGVAMGAFLVPGCLIASALVALAVYAAVERPMTVWLRRWAGDPRPGSLAAPQSPI
jgi:peptidoglycan/LPS O-acetylase OafA/YrhL